MEFDAKILEMLVCPLTKTRLTYDAGKKELVSEAAGLAFPIRENLAVMRVDQARKIDD